MIRRSLTLVAALCAGAAGAANDATPAAAPRYVQSATGSSLTFTFTQLGSATEGRFGQFTTRLAYDEKNLAASSLEVTVQIASIDTQDGERDGVLATPELFDAQKFPTATFVATSLARGALGLEAPGKLTIRGVTRPVRLPIELETSANGLELSGETTIKRLEFGIGQGDWQSTESVGDEVKVTYRVSLVRAR